MQRCRDDARVDSGRVATSEWQQHEPQAVGRTPSEQYSSPIYGSHFCSEPEAEVAQIQDCHMYEVNAGDHTAGTDQQSIQHNYARLRDDKQSVSSTSSGIKRSASPIFPTSKIYSTSRLTAPQLRARAVAKHRRTTPSAWKPDDEGRLQRYRVSQRDGTASSHARVGSSHDTRGSTLQTQNTLSSVPPVCNLLSEPALEQPMVKQDLPRQPLAPGPEYDMVKQLPRSFITQEQLAAEVKGIYAGLVMVEAKSINIDAEQAADRNRKLTPEQWQSLIALRRTLLYEHHDFLMATQHPTANSALRGLAAKYCMPARMWKHGIHGFLEVLRHRRPESQEYMLTFIYLAYNMMALLYETVPAFTDTWIECLGDLARYRMAIEEDKEIHAIWGGVAGRWYTMAADRHPQIGRLYHHLGILERPSLRKLYFYSRSLTSVVPFTNARESLGTLCAPILQDDQAIRCGPHGAEAMTICYHARVFSNLRPDLLERDGLEAMALLKEQPAGKISSFAAPLAVSNIASLFEYGMPNNIFRQMFSAELARAAHNARPSTLTPVVMSEAARAVTESEAFVMMTSPSDFVIGFMTACFNNLLRRELDHGAVRDLLQFVHVNLVFFSALLDLRTGLTLSSHIAIVDQVLNAIDWDNLATFLNTLASIDPISRRVERMAESNQFLLPEKVEERKPLAEDYMIRGIIWAEGYVAADLYEGLEDDDGSRNLETPARLHLRAERVEWLACCIGQPAKKAPIRYDFHNNKFEAQSWPGSIKRAGVVPLPKAEETPSQTPQSPQSSTTMSRQSSLVDEYEVLSMHSHGPKLDVRSQWSSEGGPAKTDASMISVPSVRSCSQASPHKRARLSRKATAGADVEIVDSEAHTHRQGNQAEQCI